MRPAIAKRLCSPALKAVQSCSWFVIPGTMWSFQFRVNTHSCNWCVRHQKPQCTLDLFLQLLQLINLRLLARRHRTKYWLCESLLWFHPANNSDTKAKWNTPAFGESVAYPPTVCNCYKCACNQLPLDLKFLKTCCEASSTIRVTWS